MLESGFSECGVVAVGSGQRHVLFEEPFMKHHFICSHHHFHSYVYYIPLYYSHHCSPQLTPAQQVIQRSSYSFIIFLSRVVLLHVSGYMYI